MKSFKRTLAILVVAAGVIALSVVSCGVTEGRKFATLQKVSHNSFPEYYKIEVAYEGGRVISGESATENTQEFEITKQAYDTLQKYLGEKIVFDYKDRRFNFVGPDRELITIQIKK